MKKQWHPKSIIAFSGRCTVSGVAPLWYTDSHAGLDSLPWSHSLGLKQDSAELPVSAGSQQCSSDCLFETICRMSATSCDCVQILWGTQGVPTSAHILVWRLLVFFPLATTALHHERLCCWGVSLAQHGCGVSHTAGEGNAIILPYSHPCMAVSPQSSSVTNTIPWLSLLQSSRLLHWNNNSRAHLRLIVQGCSLARNKDVGNYSWKNPS